MFMLKGYIRPNEDNIWIAAVSQFCRQFTILLMLIATLFSPLSGYAEGEFLVIKSKNVNLRAGPGKNYETRWVYTSRFVPLKVLSRVDRWVKVQDCEGDTGWIMAHLLSKEQYVSPTQDNTVFHSTRDNSKKVAFISDACVIMRLDKCKDNLCHVTITRERLSGWTQATNLWGIPHIHSKTYAASKQSEVA